MKRLALALTTVIILISFLLAGCEGGISQELYQGVVDQLTKAKEQIARLQDEAQEFQDEAQKWQEEKEAFAEEIKEAQEKVAQVEAQVSGLKDQFELVGATPAETAEKIVRYYHETHVYSTYDLFVCSDMASEIWNMLKAQGIDAVIVVGNKDTAILDTLDSNHAWVLAEVALGEYLALETTAGLVVQKSENPLYYRGWYFKNPRELKSHNELVIKHNVMVGMIKQLADEVEEIHEDYQQAVDEYNEMVDEFNRKYAGKPVSTESQILEVRIESQEDMVNEREGRSNQLAELVDAQGAVVKKIASEIDGLATELR